MPSNRATDCDWAWLERVDGVLNECLEATANGICDGNDIRSGTINFFLEDVVDPSSAAKSVVTALRKSGLLEGAIIALALRGKQAPAGPLEVTAWKVLWPRDHKGGCDLFCGSHVRNPNQAGADLAGEPRGTGPLTPPWSLFKGIPRNSPEWKSGPAGDYMKNSMGWFRGIPSEAQAGYPQLFREPEGWEGFYQSVTCEATGSA